METLQGHREGITSPTWPQVDKAFAEHQARLEEMGKEIDHLAISAEKYQLEVLHFFAKEEVHEKFSPLAQVAAGVK